MPIRREFRRFYTDRAWQALSVQLRTVRAGGRCEAAGCGAVNGRPHPITGSRVVLTCAHLDHDHTHRDPARLAVLCQRCHLRHDRLHHLLSRRRNAGRPDLFG
jgi:hypothetical protein